jgi:hypothetical protein
MKALVTTIIILILISLVGCLGHSWDYVKKEQVKYASLP